MVRDACMYNATVYVRRSVLGLPLAGYDQMTSFQVVGERHDCTDLNGNGTFETVYALMQHISPSYNIQFAARISEKLKQMEQDSTD